MKKKGILLVVVILLTTTGFVQAQQDQLSGTIDVTYLTSYIWRGFDYYADDHSALVSMSCGQGPFRHHLKMPSV